MEPSPYELAQQKYHAAQEARCRSAERTNAIRRAKKERQEKNREAARWGAFCRGIPILWIYLWGVSIGPEDRRVLLDDWDLQDARKAVTEARHFYRLATSYKHHAARYQEWADAADREEGLFEREWAQRGRDHCLRMSAWCQEGGEEQFNTARECVKRGMARFKEIR